MSGSPNFGGSTTRGRRGPKKCQLSDVKPTEPGQSGSVTLEHVKRVAVGVLRKRHSLPIPRCFQDVLQSEELDEFLMALLLHLSYVQEQHALQACSSRLTVESVTREEEEVRLKLELAQNKMAACYSALLLSQHQHLTCGRGLALATHRDRYLSEVLYSLFAYVAWVVFWRQNLDLIQAELSRLLRPSAFSRREDPGEAGPPRCRRQPSLKTSLSQRSVLMTAFLPRPQESSPDLFLRSSRGAGGLPGPRPPCDMPALRQELEQRLASGSFGILGKPLREVNLGTLLPLSPWRHDQEGDEGAQPAPRGSQAPTPATAGLSRAHTALSRATTEAPPSDTE